jgi:hypothetical protein
VLVENVNVTVFFLFFLFLLFICGYNDWVISPLSSPPRPFSSPPAPSLYPPPPRFQAETVLPLSVNFVEKRI